MKLIELRAERVLRVERRGSSAPVIVQTPSGRFIVKLRGAAQGLPPLIAEIVTAEIATLLGLPVPERALVELDADVPTDDRNDELADLLRASYGMNLGFRYLEGAIDWNSRQASALDREFASRVLWLDGLVANPDRTVRNPNILIWRHRPWLIDHGAALAFHYDLRALTEQSPREPWPGLHEHLLAGRGDPGEVDSELAALVTRQALTRALDGVPEAYLVETFPELGAARARSAYVAYLWKRLKSPRPFLLGV